MKTQTLTLFALLLLAPVLQAEEEAKPVVISLSAVGDFSQQATIESSLALRPQIVTRLVRDYDCVVLSRSACDSLAFEADITRFAAISDPKSKAGPVLAADYAIQVRLHDAKDPKNNTALISMQDIRKDIDIEPVRISWDVPRSGLLEHTETADAIVTKIAYSLDLRKRDVDIDGPFAAAWESRITWAILPFSHIASSNTKPTTYQMLHPKKGDTLALPPMLTDALVERSILAGFDGSWVATCVDRYGEVNRLTAIFLKEGYVAPAQDKDDEVTSAAVEHSILASAKRNRIVDRASINKVLDELKISTVLGVNENVGGQIARLVGADRLIVGTIVTQSNSKQVTLHVVDAATSVVLDAAEVHVAAGKDLAESVSAIAKQLTETELIEPSIPNSPKWQRRREADFYAKDHMQTRDLAWNPVFRTVQYNRVEICYLLMQDDLEYLRRELLVTVAEFPGFRYFPADLAHRSAFLIDAISSRFEHAPLYPCPLLCRGTAFMKVLEWQKGLDLADEHLKKHPTVRPDWANYIKAECLYYLGNKEKARELAQAVLEILEKRPDSLDLRPCSYGADSDAPQNRWQADIRGKALRLLLRIAQCGDAPDEELELFALEQGASNSKEEFDQFRLMILTKKIKGAEEALLFSPRGCLKQKASYSDFTTVAFDMMAAKYLIELGRNDEAIAIYQGVARNWPKEQVGAYSRNLLKEMGEVATKPAEPKKFAGAKEIMAFPEKYKIYCFPVAGVSSNILKDTCNRIGAWFGTEVVVKEPLPFPAGTFDTKKEFYDFHAFSRQLLQNVEIPSDAVFVLFLTHAPLSKGRYIGEAEGNPEGGNILLASHSRHSGHIVRTVIDLGYALCIQNAPPEDWLGWNRARPPARKAGCKCGNWCVGPGPWIQICEHCAEGYKTQLDQTHKSLQSFLKRKHKMLTAGSYEWGKDLPMSYSWISHIDWADESVVKQLIAAADKEDLSARFKVALLYRGGFGVVGADEKAEAMFKTLLPEIEKAAKEGSAEAQCDLGLMFKHGFGVTLNHEKALTLYLLAAQQGLPRAQHYAGIMYQTAQGTEKDIRKALHWFRLAEAQNYTETYYALGYMNHFGVGQPPGYQTAMGYYKKAADKGYAEAMHNIGALYLDGKGVSQDIKIAAEWFRKAAENGSSHGLMHLSTLYEQEKIIEE